MSASDTSPPFGTIVGLFTGKVAHPWPGKPPSAIAKRSVDGPQHIDANGFVDDQQADLTVHGGLEKALHHYPSEHMAFWRNTFPAQANQFASGCFGENLSTTGITEQDLCIGDILSLGSARVQVCQGRQPCWKLNTHTGLDQMAARFQTTGRTGWYYRVLESGTVKTGDHIELIDRLSPDWSLSKVISARFDPCLDIAVAAELATLHALSASWRTAFGKKSNRGFTENTDERLQGASGSRLDRTGG